MDYPHKNIRLSSANYLGQRWYFVTFCCDRRRRVFTSGKRARWFIDALRHEAFAHRFVIYAYCAMPDHVHFLAHGLEASSDLLKFVSSLKQRTGFEFEKQMGFSLWQKKFYDRILRPRDPVLAAAVYIWMNPVRKGICRNAKAYPYSGSFVLDWATVNLPEEEWTPPWKTVTRPRQPA